MEEIQADAMGIMKIQHLLEHVAVEKKNGQWKSGCGGYTGGKSALDHYADGLFTGNFITTWTRGKAEPVYWSTGAGHQGGYAYRLCKIPAGGVTQITEECFNQGHLFCWRHQLDLCWYEPILRTRL